LAICEKVLGVEHSDTARTYNNIAVVYYNQGDYAKTLEWYSMSYRIFRNKFGDTHPNTKTVTGNIENTYHKAGHSEPFEQWLERTMLNS
jgi:tetratricopeptide (TPR) repeat protein